MSAESFGARLLPEVQEESLASLLSDIRAFADPEPQTITGLAELDKVLVAHRYRATQDQTLEHQSSQFPTSSNPVLLSDDLASGYGLEQADEARRDLGSSFTKPKPVTVHISLTNTNSRAGSIYLLSLVTAHAVLPAMWGGLGSCLVYLDCSQSFSPMLLHRTAYSLVRRIDEDLSDDTAAAISKSCLDHVHVIKCSSSHSVLESLQGLPAYLFDRSAHRSFERRLGLLIIDGINAFHWQDRFAAELRRLENLSTAAGSSNAADNLAARILAQVKSIQALFSCTTIYTSTPTAFSVGTAASSPTPAVFDVYSHNALVQLRPTRRAVPKFAGEITVEECLKDKQQRADAVHKANEKYWIAAYPGGQSERLHESRSGRAGYESVGFAMTTPLLGGVLIE